MKNLMASLIILFAVSYSGVTNAELSCKKTSSSFVWEVCYDVGSLRLRLNLNNRYYFYCNVPSSLIDKLLSASSKGRF